MPRSRFVPLIALVIIINVACQEAPPPGPGSEGKSAPKDDASVAAASDAKSTPSNEDQSAGPEKATAESGEESGGTEPRPTEPWLLDLKDSRMQFLIPSSWKKVPPQNRIIEAEFELPRAPGDEFDGRLTMMAAMGDPEQAIAIRKSEFRMDPGEHPPIEELKIPGVEAKLVDIRGEWKGISGQRMEPRPDYRMLLAIFPYSRSSAFYVKLTGPRETVALHEDEFRALLDSARMAAAAE